MTRELLLRQPAEVRPAGVLTAPYYRKRELLAEAQKLSRAGHIEVINPRPTWNAHAQRWELVVRELARPTPWPLRLGIATVVLAVVAAVVWLLSTLTATALGALCLAALAFLGMLVHLGRRPSITVTTITQTKIR